MPTPQWIKNLAGESGVHYVMAELLKRGILATMTPAQFPEEDIYMVKKGGDMSAFIQVKSLYPLRSSTFDIGANRESWASAPSNQYVAFVWLGVSGTGQAPTYWIATKSRIGELFMRWRNPKDNRCRLAPDVESGLDKKWKWGRLENSWRDNWASFDEFLPAKSERQPD